MEYRRSRRLKLTRPAVTLAVVKCRLAAWSRKDQFTFADALALLCREVWAHQTFWLSADDTHTVTVPRLLIERLTNTLRYAA